MNKEIIRKMQYNPEHNFRGVTKMVSLGSGTPRANRRKTSRETVRQVAGGGLSNSNAGEAHNPTNTLYTRWFRYG